MYTNKKITEETEELKEALDIRGVKTELEKFDGHKHIDIAVTESRMNIEVDGNQHFTNPRQIESDFYRSKFSYAKGFNTIHIPNRLIKNNKLLNRMADALAKVAYKLKFKYNNYYHKKNHE